MRLFILAFFLFYSTDTISQFRQKPPIDTLAIARTKSMQKICNLDTAQYKLLLGINRWFLTKTDSAYGRKMKMEEEEKELMETTKKYRRQLKDVMSKEQFEKFRKTEKKQEAELEKEMRKRKIKYKKINDTDD